MCAIIGIYANEPVAQDIYDGLITLQHRGQDASGILTYDNQFHLKKGMGLVREIFDEHNMLRLTGNLGIGHNRYPTAGCIGIEEAQPFLLGSPFGIGIAHNGNLTNYTTVKKELFEKDLRHMNSTCDSEALLNVLADAIQKQKSTEVTPELLFNGVEEVFKRVSGAYSVIGMIAGHGLFAIRDPYGIRPLIMGKREDRGLPEYIFASENVAIQTLGYEVVRDVKPGEVIFVDRHRQVHSKVITQKGHHPCIFEYVYFARPDSIIDKISVYEARIRMGRKLAEKIKEANLEIDVVVPVPDSARSAALELAFALGLKYREGLIKNRYIGRTFIMPDQAMRQKSVRYKLNPLPIELAGRNVLLVDDSIVRGTTSRKIVRMVRQAGAKKVYFASCAPPLKFPCLYGVDIPTRKELVASSLTIDQIAKEITADALFYQELQDLHDACGGAKKEYNPDISRFCSACMDGKYPTPEVTEELLAATEKQREVDLRVPAHQMRLI